MSGNRRNPYATVAAVWIVSSFGLGLVATFPISFVVLLFGILFFVLAVVGCLVYKAHRRDLNNRDLAENLLSSFRGFVVKIFEDFGIVFARVSAWWLRREARIQQEMAQERERRDRKKEKRAQLERKRKAKRSGEHPPRGGKDIRRRSQEEQAEG